MDTKKILQIFLGSWAVLIFLVALTDAADMGPVAQVISTGVLALLVTLLAIVATRSGNKKVKTIHLPGDPAFQYRVEDKVVYRGKETSPVYYVKRGALYGFEHMNPLCSLKDGKITREGESEPFLRVEGDKVISCESGQVIYEIR